MMGVSL